VIPHSFHPEAEAEFVEATLFYESRVKGLGRLFSVEVQRVISLIRRYPDAGAPIQLPTRRTLVDRFRTLLSIDMIRSRLSFLQLRIFIGDPGIGGFESSAPMERWRSSTRRVSRLIRNNAPPTRIRQQERAISVQVSDADVGARALVKSSSSLRRRS